MEVDMLLRKRDFLPDGRKSVLIYVGCGLLFLLAIILRVSLYPVESMDYRAFLDVWYNYIQSNGGFAALKDNFSNYNTPYLYLLAIASYTPIPAIVAVKTISVIFDVVLGIFTYLIIHLKYRQAYAALGGALVILFAPTIFINSAYWGQCDAIYTAFCLGSLYFMLKDRPGWACAFAGFAISFKLQAIFFLPILLVLLLRKKLPWKFLVLIPVVFLVLLVPAMLAGRSAESLITIYVQQAADGGVATGNNGGLGMNGGMGRAGNGYSEQGQGQFLGGNGEQRQYIGGEGTGQGQFTGDGGQGQFTGNGGGGMSTSSSSLVYNAPTIYQWLPTDNTTLWEAIGILLAGGVVVGVSFLVWKSKVELTPTVLLRVALVFALAIPFLLPKMHERYFYLADVLTIVYAFYFPRYFYIALVMQLSSLASYAPFLLNNEVIGLSFVALAVLVITVIAARDLIRTLYPDFKINLIAETPEGSLAAGGAEGSTMIVNEGSESSPSEVESEG
jgi:Gpi18-like mannosyltransferase